MSLLEDLKSQIKEIESGARHKRGSDYAQSSDIDNFANDSNYNLGSQHDPLYKTVPDPLLSAEAKKAFDKVIRWCATSERSSVQIQERLRKEGFDDQAIQAALQRSIELHVVDDVRFAEWLVRSRLRKGYGVAGINRELKQHNLELESIPGWPEAFDEYASDQIERALTYLERHPPRSKRLRESAYRSLVRKGYTSSDASTAARIWSERHVDNL